MQFFTHFCTSRFSCILLTALGGLVIVYPSNAQVTATTEAIFAPAATSESALSKWPKPPARSITLPEPSPPSHEPTPNISDRAPEKARQNSQFHLEWRDPGRRIVLHTPRDMQEQGVMFSRIVLFLEMRSAPKTEVIAQRDLSGWFSQHKINPHAATAGNNLRASDLARFFNTARIQNEPLSASEQALLDRLLEVDILARSHGGYKASQPEQMLITVPKPSTVEGCSLCTVSTDLHEAILTHELGHARYFLEPVYRDFSNWFWSHGLDERLRQAFTELLKLRGYDEVNRNLLADEMQAFLMHTPSSQLFSATMLGTSAERLAATKAAFFKGLSALDMPLSQPLLVPPQ